ncbi:LacI family DNA-binding transcriptional regulator [Rhizobium sp. TRM96647]|uniref:LacI family DNA-binding transcriptional regulator n=1 Tax=unclassified Rhizobium TaxID=2613769 RepID=UPI0021E74132|nr:MULTISPECIES: LacI family DNA-binding transcriptional regulator [unclassified Rhizobium]MCV3736143.1 LacI family DNA-binding transcriptional regulator [Rhizobium sp. TRM96647]MCV3758195.1 LacI family DNA-binding transcriptional regulator [Rhizobium sp. TRM96650]
MTRTTQTKRTTIYDLAELAGTSASAVSAVLNGNWKKRRISARLAEKITRLAEEQGYALNMQASVLRRDRSKIIGMIVPKYDNRYFGSIVEQFEALARERGLFPIITCTMRDPALELDAARAMLSYQVDCLIATGATDPDRVMELCAAAGVRTVNLDLPGARAPSVISDNHGGALELTRRVLANCEREYGEKTPLLFVGGRGTDHNTLERVRGFRDAHAEAGVAVDETLVLTCGYAPEKAESAMKQLAERTGDLPRGMFVNSTISLEGVMRWIRRSGHYADRVPQLGCFDWDPFVAMLGDHIEMVRQDVPRMLEAVFAIIESGATGPTVVQIPPIVEKTG